MTRGAVVDATARSHGASGGPHFLGDAVVSLTVVGDSMCKASDKTCRLDTPWAQEFLEECVPLP